MHSDNTQLKARGINVLHDPRLNKSTAFTEAERETLGLTGLLPSGVDSTETQILRVMRQLDTKSTDLERHIYLIGLLDNDEALFYRLLMSDPARFLPIVYSPTVGEACQKYGHILRRPRGMYLSLRHRGRVREVLRNWPVEDVRVICATTGGRILGLGDLGANGMGIAIGKLSLYTACAAVPPQYLLPMHIDCGTNNEALRGDPLYLGLRQPRVPASELDEFVEEFVTAVQDVFPCCCIHFEDWAGVDAVRLLARYRDRVCCFNDDIQGTAGMVLAGLLTALRVTGERLGDQRILFLGAGSAATGVADMIVEAMMLEGLTRTQAQARISLFNTKGLLVSARTDLHDFQRPYAHPVPPENDFAAVIGSLKPGVIIGLSTQGRAFNKNIIGAMARINNRPIILALSNPTVNAECTAREAYQWSGGRALFAAGVPFSPVQFGGKTHIPGQANNLFIFPAIGLAVYAARARRVTDEMFIAAAKGVAELVTQEELDSGLLYPPQSNILPIEIAVARRVAEIIFERNLAGVEKPADLEAFLEAQLYRLD